MNDVTEILVELSGVSKSYGSVIAVQPLDLQIRRGEFLAILGPSGCGKTTLLGIIGGFVETSSGSISIAGVDVTRVGAEHRPTNMVFQGYGLFEHMSVAQNIAYGLRIAKTSRDEIDRRVNDMIELVHLDALADRKATDLSGGQQQRVALARALIMRPDVLLLDEPLAALDLKLRKAMQSELRRIHQSIGGTFVFVTHDQAEAMGLASRICVMENGSIVQEGTPEEIYSAPRSRFVSTFIGEANTFQGKRAGGRVTLAEGPIIDVAGPDGDVVVVVRPEHVKITPMSERDQLSGCCATLEGQLVDAVFLGPNIRFSVDIGSGTLIDVDCTDVDMRQRTGIGETVTIGWHRNNHRILADQ